MAQISFPAISPSSRSFTAGEYPQTVFEAQNGAKSIIRYGNKAVNAKLSLGFTNISDDKVNDIINNYIDVNSDWDYVMFTSERGLQGIENTSLKDQVIYGASSGVKWRYDGPPKVTSVQPGINNVSCKFVACLDGD
tara:strand:- start:2613 stop:3020 length:408 start_codon:yes stop_codon:yes gene_type:complete